MQTMQSLCKPFFVVFCRSELMCRLSFLYWEGLRMCAVVEQPSKRSIGVWWVCECPLTRCAAQQSSLHRRPRRDAATECVGSPLQQVQKSLVQTLNGFCANCSVQSLLDPGLLFWSFFEMTATGALWTRRWDITLWHCRYCSTLSGYSLINPWCVCVLCHCLQVRRRAGCQLPVRLPHLPGWVWDAAEAAQVGAGHVCQGKTVPARTHANTHAINREKLHQYCPCLML